MSLTGDQEWATNWGRQKGLLQGSETATNGLLAGRIGSNSNLMSEFDTGIKGFRTSSGVRPTNVASTNLVQQEAIARIAGGSGEVEGKYFNPYTTNQRTAIDAASNIAKNISIPKINNFRAYDQSGMSQFENPYLEKVIGNNARRSRDRELERRNEINEGFAEVGGYGSTALGLERSRNAVESERGISEMDANLRHQGFDMATGRNMQLYEADRNDDFRRQVTNSENALREQTGQLSGLSGVAGLYSGGLRDAMSLDNYGRTVGNQNLDRMLFAGDRVQQQNQREVDVFYGVDATQRQFPYTQNQFLADILARYPTGQQTTSTQPSVGAGQGALGGALVGSSLVGGSDSALPWQTAGNVRPSYIGGGFY